MVIVSPMLTSGLWRQGQISRPCRFVTRQLMLVHRRAIPHATLCPGVLGRYTLRYRIVGAFQTPSGSQAVFVMDVVGLCKCTRTSKHRCKQGGNRSTRIVFLHYSRVETNSRTNGNGKLSILSCPCRVFSRIKTLTGGALIYVNDQSGTSDALAAAQVRAQVFC
jgi:hypothetical protein